MADAQELGRFFSLISRLKALERTGWKEHGVQPPRDTSASHSFGAALLGWVRAREEGLDEEKVVKMLLLHDLVEAVIGDLTDSEVPQPEKRAKEDAGFDRIIRSLPESIRDEAAALFAEFQEWKSPEATLAKECDKLDTLFQALDYGKRLKGIEKDFLKTYEHVFSTEKGKKLYAWIKKQAGQQAKK